MLQFPPIPSWESLHPIVIHFPIVLLLLSPVFVLISAVLSPLKGRQYLGIAVALLLTGTAGLFLAAETGESAAELADRTPSINLVLQSHQSLAFDAQIVFSVFSALLIALFAVTRNMRRPLDRFNTRTLPFIFLALYSSGVVLLVDTAHQGARLVHEFGVHALIAPQRDAQTRH